MIKRLSSLLLITAVIFSACQKANDISVLPVGSKIDTLKGNISSDRILDGTKSYILDGKVFVTNNAILTIPEGITISAIKYEARDEKSSLIITKGSKININGSLEKPVVFTSAATTKAPGDWGAIIILGNSFTNIQTGNIPGFAVSGLTEFGGTNPTENSGSIKYLRVEYCGGINPDNEDEWAVDKASGLSLEGVGSGTTIDNVMITHSNDDAFQFVGGTVNATHLIGYNNGDDDFDFDLGFQGKLQYIISYRTELLSTHALRANGIETYNDEVPTANKPLTRPIVSNATIIGPQGMEATKTNLNQGVYIRKGTRFVVQNSIIAEYPQGGLMVCNRTRPVLLANAGSQFRYNLVNSDSVSRTFSWDRDYAVFGDPVLRTFALNSVNNNTLVEQSSSLKFKTMYGSDGPDLTLMDGSEALSGSNFDGDDFSTFFEKTTYRGAVGNVNWAAASKWAIWK